MFQGYLRHPEFSARLPVSVETSNASWVPELRPWTRALSEPGSRLPSPAPDYLQEGLSFLPLAPALARQF